MSEDEPAQPDKPTLSDAEIDNYLAIMTKMNNKSHQAGKMDEHQRMMISFLYIGALH